MGLNVQSGHDKVVTGGASALNSTESCWWGNLPGLILSLVIRLQVTLSEMSWKGSRRPKKGLYRLFG